VETDRQMDKGHWINFHANVASTINSSPHENQVLQANGYTVRTLHYEIHSLWGKLESWYIILSSSTDPYCCWL